MAHSFADYSAPLRHLHYKPRRGISQMKGIGHGTTANTQETFGPGARRPAQQLGGVLFDLDDMREIIGVLVGQYFR